ncbi:hypothetical protein BHYA_0173g00160 [Botrytis hyacinthi]|uniref:SWIM-type domain-containing protein n=1 Tax=Botrytis hyacinthi TaxID=278943 RepID=A0A4Z1GHV5_9HELO|nr:hypothetical protein BHYA_0173g00160 [Botrytis hyacinthi]
MPSLSSRMSRSSDSTTASGPYSSTPSMDIDIQLTPLPETRKRSRNLDSDSDEEEPQAQRARYDGSNSIQNIESEMAIDTPARNVMAPPRSMHPRVRSGRRTMSRQEQEQISSTFANIGAPALTPASTPNPNPNHTQPAPVSSLPRASHTAQASTTRQSSEATSQSRLYEEISDYDADTHEDERPPKRRRVERQNSVHTPAVPIEDRNVEVVAPPASNEASVVEHQGSETASSLVSGVLLAIEAPSNQIASTRRDAPYIDLTLEDSSDEEEDDTVLPPAPSVFPAVQAPSVRNIQPNAKPKFVDLTFDDSSHKRERTATMSQAYIGDRIVLVQEKRLEPFLPEPTTRFQNLLEDARTQELQCLDKWASPEHKDDVEFSRQLAVLGTSGNVYMVIIEKKPECNCYEGIRDILCVHIVFILTQFLNLPAPLRHQTAFLEAELRCMMGDEIDWMSPVSTDKFCTQKSVEEQETCSICLENLTGHEPIAWCRGQCGKNFHLQCIWTWAETNFQDGQPDITCGNCRTPWIWVGRELSFLIETAWNLQYDISYKEAGYRTLSELLKRDVSKEGYFNVAELVGIDETMEDDAEARRSYQQLVDRWRLEMARRPTTLLEEVGNFIYRYHTEVYDDVDDESNDSNSPRAIRALELVKYVEMNVGRVLQGFPAIDSEVFRDLHLL